MNTQKFINEYLAKGVTIHASYEHKNFIFVVSEYKNVYILSWYNKFFRKDQHQYYLKLQDALNKFTDLVNICNNFK